MKECGYTTAAVDCLVTHTPGLAGWFSRGFDFYLGFKLDKLLRFQTQSNTLRALEMLEELAPGPFFLMLHLWDGHAPYLPPVGTPDYEQSRVSASSEWTRADVVTPLALKTMGLGDVTNLDHVIARYDASIWNADRHLGEVLDKLDELGIAENTLVCATSAHGECFGEGGVYFDHVGHSDAVIRTPARVSLAGSDRPGPAPRSASRNRRTSPRR